MSEKKTEKDSEKRSHRLGEQLYSRPHPEGYIEEWLKLMEEASSAKKPEGISVIVFRLDTEWMALPTMVIERITPMQFIHKLPFKSNAVVLGITNIEGELRMAISLKALLGLPNNITLDDKRLYSKHPRAIVFGNEADFFVFPVDEIGGTALFKNDDCENVPLTVSKSMERYTTHLFRYKDKHAGLLNADLIIENIHNNYL